MTQIVLRCTVPVFIYVETGDDADGKENGWMGVNKVVVDDESLDLTNAVLSDRDLYENEEHAAKDLAAAIEAAVDCEWPSWEFGF